MRTEVRADKGGWNKLVDKHERALVLSLLAAAIVLRVLWLFWNAGGLTPSITEPQRVAESLVRTGWFSDAFRRGSGPTAHLSPLMPWLISLPYRTLGIASPASEIALSLLAICLVTTSFLFVYLAQRELGASLRSRIVALAVVALLPIQLPLEARELKVWETPLVIACVTGVLWRVVRLDRLPDLRWPAVAMLALPGAVISAASPPGSAAVFCMLSILCIRRLPTRAWLPVAGVTALSTLAILLPWALRNETTMGRAVWTRSNAGLELALAYNDTMLKVPDRRAAYKARLAEIHPISANGRAYTAMTKAGGELIYYDRLGTETRNWIRKHPVATADLFARHVRQYLLPPAWFFNTWGGPASSTEVRRWLLGMPTMISLFGIFLMIKHDRRYLYVLGAIVFLVFPYLIVQPILRYRYLTSTLSVFIAFSCLSTALQSWRRVH